MMFEFLTQEDGTEIVHSEMRPDKTVKVYIEKPDEECGFLSSACILPDYKREDVRVFPADAIMRYKKVIRSTAHLILRVSR